MTNTSNYLRYLELAKAADLAETLSAQGFSVEVEASVRDVTFDVLARSPGATVAYAIKAAGSSRLDRTELRRVQEVAQAEGYDLRIVVVNPPPRVHVEVDELKSRLLNYAVHERFPKELDGLSNHTRIDRLSEVEISDIRVHPSSIEVEGRGSLEVTLQYDGEEDRRFNNDIYPFHFAAILNRDTSLASVGKFEVDTSSFDRT